MSLNQMHRLVRFFAGELPRRVSSSKKVYKYYIGSQIQFNNEAYKLLSIKRKLCSDDDSICPDKKKAIATPIKFKPQKIVPNVVTPMDDGEFVFVPTSVSEIEDPISNDKLLQNSNSGINMNLVDAFKDGNNVSHIENFQVALKTPKRDSLMPYSSYATQSKQYSPSSIEHGSQVKPDVCQKKSIEIIALDSDSEGLDTSVKGRFRFNVPSKNLETSSEGQGRSLFLTAASSSFQSTSTPISYSFNRRTLSPRGFSTTIKPNEKPFDRARYRDAIGFDATSEEEVQESPVQSGPESQSESLFVDDSGIRQCASKSENCNFLNDNEADQKKETDNNCDKILPARTHISIADYLASLEQPDYRMMDTPNGLLVELKSFQRQSLAFMYDVEKIKSDCWSHPTGGLLTDEVGMGKTAVCIALILSNPGVPLIKKPLIYGLKNAERVRTKATLIIAPPSILGQWEIELKKFAPRTLRILWHYGSKRNNNIDLDFTFYDVVLTTVGCLPSDRSKDVVWHRYLINNRIILDEIHCKKSGIAKKLLCTYKWGITATPLSKSKEELAELLKQISNAPDQKESVSCDCALGNTALGQAIDRLHLPLVKKVVMRHSKEGEKAFGENNPEDSMILPSSNVRNLISRLSHDEKIVYDFVVSRKSKAIKSFAQSSTGNTFAIDNMIEPFLQAVNSPGYVTFISHFEMPATLRDYKNLPEYKALKRQYDIAKLASERCKSIIPSKIKSLKADLEEKLKLNPAARVLILTRSLRLLPLLIDSIQQVGFHVESFTGEIS